jgi:hypothetical protein
MDWFDDGFMPSLASLDANRLLMYEINGPLNLAPLYQNTSPIPASLAAYRAIPASPVLPPGVGPGNSEVVIDINIDQGNGGEGEPGPPGPDGGPGPAGPDGDPGPDGDDVCTCAMEVQCSTTYKNTAKCRTSIKIEWQQGTFGDPPEPCGCDVIAEGWVESEVTWGGEHTSTSYFPPGYFSVADPAIASGLDGYGGTDYTAGVRQTAAASLYYEERITAKKGKDILDLCGIEGSDGVLPTSTCLPTCGEFDPEVWGFDEEATTAYRVTWTADRELGAMGYVDTGSEEITSIQCDDEVNEIGPTGDTSPETTIAPPLLCDGGPGEFPIGPEAPGAIPTEFIIPPACCSDCVDAGGSSGTLGTSETEELESWQTGLLAGTPSRCLFDYLSDPFEPTSASSANATINAVPSGGPITWGLAIDGVYSFTQEFIEDNWTDPAECNETKTTYQCVWSGSLQWSAEITILFVPEV